MHNIAGIAAKLPNQHDKFQARLVCVFAAGFVFQFKTFFSLSTYFF
jgi:hypothetical protein